MGKVDAEQRSDKETARRRDEIVRVMANTPPQPRVANRPVKARQKAASTVSGRKAASAVAANS